MSEKVKPVSKMLTTFLENMEHIREGGDLAFTPEEIKKIARIKPQGQQITVSQSKTSITFGPPDDEGGIENNSDDGITFTKTAKGIHQDDNAGGEDYASVDDLIGAYAEENKDDDDIESIKGVRKEAPGYKSPIDQAAEMGEKNEGYTGKNSKKINQDMVDATIPRMSPQEKAAFMRWRNSSKMVPDKSKLKKDVIADLSNEVAKIISKYMPKSGLVTANSKTAFLNGEEALKKVANDLAALFEKTDPAFVKNNFLKLALTLRKSKGNIY